MELKEVTLKEFENLCQELFQLREEKEAIERTLKAKNAEIDKLQSTILLHMKDLEKTSYDSAKGKLVVTTRFTVTTPKGEAKDEFFSYLKERGVFEDLVSVNSQTLNAWYKQEMEVARETGNFDFQIPGIGEPTAYEQVMLRKK